MDQADHSLGIKLDSGTSVPLYRQIADQMAARIARGELAPGTRLPPTRVLAAALDTHRNTVVRAFEELSAEGWIAGHVGRGSYVQKRLEPEGTRVAERQTGYDPGATRDLPWDTLLSRAIESEPLRRMQRLGSQSVGADIVNLARMQASADLLPHAAFRSCLDHVMETLGPDALGYAPGQGLERLRIQIAAELGRRGMAVDTDDILVTTGSQQAIDVVARALVNPGDVFLTEGRTYSGALNVLTASGAEVIGVPTDTEGPDLEALRRLSARGAKGLYLMPNSRNPTGSSISEARRRALVEWSLDARVPLVEDDYGADLILEPGPTLSHLRALDPNVFHVGTYSKKLIPALRVGFIVCPSPMRGPLTRLKHAMDLGTSTLLQHALAEFLERGLLEAHLQAVCRAYRERRDALVGALRAVLPDEVTFEVPDRGVVLWLSLPAGLDPETVYEAARLEGVIVSPGNVYATTSPPPAGLRLAYCYEPADRLVEGARRLGRALHRTLTRRGHPRRVELFGA